MTITLTDHKGKTLRMQNGEPFTYSSVEIAKRAKRILEAQKDCMTVFRIEGDTSAAAHAEAALRLARASGLPVARAREIIADADRIFAITEPASTQPQKTRGGVYKSPGVVIV